MEVLGTPQHWLMCDICEENCVYYCNSCNKRLCDKCHTEHHTNEDTKTHDLILYQLRQKSLGEEKCPHHPTKDLDMLCEECQVALCYKCSMTEAHSGHHFIDLEEISIKNFEMYENELSRIQDHFLPACHEVLNEIKEDVPKVKKMVALIRETMTTEANALKSLVDRVLSENFSELDSIEERILHDLTAQDKTFTNYISYLQELLRKYQSKLAKKNLEDLISKQREDKAEEIDPIPETFKPVLPIFTGGQFTEDDIKKFLGKISFPKVTKARRHVRVESRSEEVDVFLHEDGKEQQKGKVNPRPDKQVTFSVSMIKEIMVPRISFLFHISLETSKRFWVSSFDEYLVQTDLQGNLLHKLQITGGIMRVGCHTVTKEGDLLFADRKNKCINRVTPDKMVTELFTTEDWEPLGIYSSRINGDILMGKSKDKDREARVTRYSKAGVKLQDIRKKHWIKTLYEFPAYLTENNNGDICTSDIEKEAVVVVDKSGKHRFSYTGQQSESSFSPRGICTDAFSHILVCDENGNSVHLLDQDGHFLSLLINQNHGLNSPCGLGMDEENNLYVGEFDSNTVKVSSYLDQY
ncbi:uncharacterized protein LOC134264009 [Saccostrea cucullata]|uniref:uncharacterized protein LOC134238112 n=1 Tax=Saccostrea cuccullata TaxID=36930 RepID=UPI002ED20CE8